MFTGFETMMGDMQPFRPQAASDGGCIRGVTGRRGRGRDLDDPRSLLRLRPRKDLWRSS